MCRQSNRSRAQAKHPGEGAGELVEEEAGVQGSSRLAIRADKCCSHHRRGGQFIFGFVKGQSVARSKASIVFLDIEFVEAEIKLSAAGLVQKL